MNKKSLVFLIVGIVLVCLFLVSWLVFKNIKTTDWLCLILGVLDLGFFAYTLKKDKQ